MDHMAKEPFEILWWPVLALVLLLANSRALWVESGAAVLIFTAVVIAGYLHYVTCIINEICGFLGIRCLTIRPHED
jgi:ethanolaminephosphotransferase